jgi:fluoroacetyl-CoA thioesterase
MPKPVPPGARATITRTVEFQHTLTAHLDTLPPVLTTPDMIGWMEFACLEALQPYCEGDEITVGTHIQVMHKAPTGVGSRVTAEAELERVEGRFHMMKVTARDENGVIGEGYVGRAFVSHARFLERTGRKRT